MSMKFSTGFRDAANVTSCIKDMMANSIIAIFNGTRPDSADDTEEDSTLLMLITLDGGDFVATTGTNGLNMGDSSSGVLSKDTSETWQGTGLTAAGTGTTATWFRWYDVNYTTGASSTAIRADGNIGTSSSYDIKMSNTKIVEDVVGELTSFDVTFPES